MPEIKMQWWNRKIDSKAAQDEFQSMLKKYGGDITPEEFRECVITNRNSHFYKSLCSLSEFELAKKQQLNIARGILRSLVEVNQETQTRYLVNVIRKGRRCYVPMVQALKDPKLRVQVLEQARRDIATFQRKYRDIEELITLLGVMKRTERSLTRRLQPPQATI